MEDRDLDELIRARRNIQALALIRERSGCSLIEAVEVLHEHHQRLKAEQPYQRSPTNDDVPGRQAGHEAQAVDHHEPCGAE